MDFDDYLKGGRGGVLGWAEGGSNFQMTKKRKKGEEECPVCHGAGATTDHHDPCTEGGDGNAGG